MSQKFLNFYRQEQNHRGRSHLVDCGTENFSCPPLCIDPLKARLLMGQAKYNSIARLLDKLADKDLTKAIYQ